MNLRDIKPSASSLSYDWPSQGGAINLSKQLAILDDSGTNPAANYTLADGYENQIIYLAWRSAGGGGNLPINVNLTVTVSKVRESHTNTTSPFITNNYVWAPFDRVGGAADSAAGIAFAIFVNGAWVLSRQTPG